MRRLEPTAVKAFREGENMKERRPRQGASGLATAADDRTILREIAAGDLSRFDVLVDRYK